ncbi:type II secretion system secretin GspD [Thiospirillum jenense]|uniref:Type II secretion system secretin GspD n=1 Tax=Thiospirillum jenense TaxID=1653858 RepID=A0A839HE71_9GAMM|nr:type II secretion system secretin GspD [Thiospirillum jenense]MBB1126931.1 type II secretion system secretin GspD [Thiospirillum jenense]
MLSLPSQFNFIQLTTARRRIQSYWLIASATAIISGCSSLVFDPSAGISSNQGHIADTDLHIQSQTATAEHLPPAGGIAIGNDPLPKAQTRIERGTGRFVGQVKRPKVDTTPGDVTLNFDGTDIREVVKVILGELLGANYVIDPAVQGSVSLQTGRALRRDLLLPTLETLLRMNNAALIDKGDRYEVVPIGNAVRGRSAPQLGENIRALPSGYTLQIIPLRYIGAQEMANILEPLAPEGSIVRVDTLRNLLVIAAAGAEMTQLIDTIEVFDVDWMAGLSVGFFTLEYAKAKDVVAQLEALLTDEKSNPLTGMFRFIPVDSANALLVISPQPSYLEKMQHWIERLDLAEASGTSAQQLYVYRVKHGDAENLADVLSQLFASDGGSTASKRTVGSVAPGKREASTAQTNTNANGKTNTSSSTSRRAATSNTLELSSQVSVVADAVNNSLLIKSSPRDYKKILDALKQLDIMPLQVLVEATIVEIALTGSLEYGVQWNLFAGAKDGYVGNASLMSSKTDVAAPTLPGFNWSVVLQPDTIRANLNALASDGLVNVLSSPSVMVMDNQEAKIQVGKEVPIATTQQQGTSTTERIVNQIEYRSIGVMLTVKPRVTPGGLVQMEIEQEVSTVAEESGALDSPTFSTRNITSNVAVRSNQAVVLGGLIQDNREDNKSGLPGLYRAPFVGGLFGKTARKAERTELVVVLTPRVIASDSDVANVTNDFRRKVRTLKKQF